MRLYALFQYDYGCHNRRPADGIYDYVHYHSRVHEVLGIARGEGKVQFGGHGRILTLKAGDVAILPAGTGHQRLSARKDGAYPPSGTYDECTSSEDHKRALATIPGRTAAQGPGLRREGTSLERVAVEAMN